MLRKKEGITEKIIILKLEAQPVGFVNEREKYHGNYLEKNSNSTLFI